ncbi:HlyD family efflux transporter periplasmic adaptor subunit [Paracraurococcus ruber]|uniref:Multidrug transporter n=1 Tax=Paracraurococcus ruber TaxID=77675 RepID=A0ABS1D308_9PROT|nr:HlyD family efflux transporter periplasmic adaptor subunit [Paracraurococcus ruber]MBK1660820.1 multidrug transporter [Paracraurococcus ruber]TDG27013.1 HlyD family efflux transporter periplasmic adaptor subunit [Paracraurococcus ruber]
MPAKRPLFRQDVVAFQQLDRQWGRVVPLQPLRLRLTVWFIIAAVASVIGFLFFAQYARKETVAGYLIPAAGTARVFVSQPGNVGALFVEQGQLVEEGQPLLTVVTGQISDSGEDVNATILASLRRQREEMLRQVASEERRTASERERLQAQIQGYEAELGQIEAQVTVQRERIRVVERILASGQQLAARGLASELDQRRREENLLEQRQALNSLAQQYIARRSQMTEARFTLEQLPFQQAEKIQALRNDLSAAEQRIAEVDGRRAYVLRAPMAGRISSLQATVGQPARPDRLLLQIIPAAAALQAELFIPARAIGFVAVGQPVRILYDAFPYQHFGTYRGRIETVSQSILTASDIATPVTLKEPAYRATVSLERPDVDAYGRRVPLQPDMLLRADIILERRTLVDWILNPLLSARIQG